MKKKVQYIAEKKKTQIETVFVNPCFLPVLYTLYSIRCHEWMKLLKTDQGPYKKNMLQKSEYKMLWN